MKRVILILISLVLSAQLQAQEETLISGPIENGGFGGPTVKFSSLNNKFALLVGGGGGWLINHSFLIGGAGYGLVNTIDASDAARAYYGIYGDMKFDFGYGGLLLEYIGSPNDLLHYTISALIGAGGVTYREQYDNWINTLPNDHASPFFVLEPGVTTELNVTRFFRLNAGVGYRLVRGSDLPGISDSELSDVAVNLTFKFGKF